jgi:hypothetical protein
MPSWVRIMSVKLKTMTLDLEMKEQLKRQISFAKKTGQFRQELILSFLIALVIK